MKPVRMEDVRLNYAHMSEVPKGLLDGDRMFFIILSFSEFLKAVNARNIRTDLIKAGKKKKVHSDIAMTISDEPENFVKINGGAVASAINVRLHNDNSITFMKFGLNDGGNTQAVIRDIYQKDGELPKGYVRLVVNVTTSNELHHKLPLSNNHRITVDEVSKLDFEGTFKEILASFTKKTGIQEVATRQSDRDSLIHIKKIVSRAAMIAPTSIVSTKDKRSLRSGGTGFMRKLYKARVAIKSKNATQDQVSLMNYMIKHCASAFKLHEELYFKYVNKRIRVNNKYLESIPEGLMDLILSAYAGCWENGKKFRPERLDKDQVFGEGIRLLRKFNGKDHELARNPEAFITMADKFHNV